MQMRRFCAGMLTSLIYVQQRPVNCVKETYVWGKETSFLNVGAEFLRRYQNNIYTCAKETSKMCTRDLYMIEIDL